ncbi:MAG: tRNA (adenine-N1)-methyltransferase [Acidimicrobiia bacterium]|nr:tRNA (adenine-N1)-methyltransferase [Acidimicrobiia bacterium]
MSSPFADGDSCLLIDTKGRQYLIELRAGATFHYHSGVVPHDSIIGTHEGVRLTTSTEARLVALRPRLADYILRMKRGAQVVYPKDIGPIIVWGDIGPGMTVVEAGTGSGALAMALARAVGPAGRVVSVERRSDHAAHARKVISRFFGDIPEQLELRDGEVVDAITDVQPDRIVLDIPAPWEVVTTAEKGLAVGGVLVSYLPTVPQVERLRDAMRERFIDTMTAEFMMREWAVDGRSVRPEHRMVGHTGFITTGRLVDPRNAKQPPEGAATTNGDGA